MCGITGVYNTGGGDRDLAIAVRRMSATLRHRGPDDAGDWCDREAGIALGFRRLAIVDLSESGHQPMVSATGRYVIVLNGEVYNFGIIRRELESSRMAPPFRGTSDTEVLLAAIEAWGVERAVGRCVGMFAIAIWDTGERTLHLVRDRLGIKPLYYAWQGETLLFGSELKALRAYSGFRAEIDRDALTLFLRHNYIPAPFSIYRSVRKLEPGTILSVLPSGRVETSVYWSMRAVVETGQAEPFTGAEADAEECLDVLLRDSIGLRMIADVPLGAFLSGGVDSSTVVALMQSLSSRPVKTFTVGFHEDSYNEATFAAAVARHLGADHTELWVTAEEARGVIPKLPALYDEPFADASQIPTYLVSELARRHVTVGLSGDGGDELLGGYMRYFWCQSIWSRARRIPRPLRSAAAAVVQGAPQSAVAQMFRLADPLMPRAMRQRRPADKLAKLAEVLPAGGPDAMYRALVSHWKAPETVVVNASEPETSLTAPPRLPARAELIDRMMYLDTITYLPDDILVKLDRASMGVSLEARVPLIDHRVVEFAWRLPASMKVRNGQGKWLLRRVLNRYVPRDLIERPKTGFGVPLDSWLRGPLRAWAEELMDEHRLRREGFFHPAPIRRKWEEHLSGNRNWQYYLWSILVFQAWLEQITG